MNSLNVLKRLMPRGGRSRGSLSVACETWPVRVLRSVRCLVLSFLLLLLVGCARTVPVAIESRALSYRIPDSLLTRLEIPLFERPVTVEKLLVQLRELEDLVDEANVRFEEIRILQQ